MNQNIYAPPASDIALRADTETSRLFYVVSPLKFAVLFCATLGAYQLYWFYKNWTVYKAATGARVLPVMRALFPVFFVHSLFGLVEFRLSEESDESSWNDSGHATLLVVLMIVSNILDQLSRNSVASPISDIASIAMLAPLLFSFRKAQGYINKASGDPAGETNSAFTPLNYLWIVLGLVMWGLVALGLLQTAMG